MLSLTDGLLKLGLSTSLPLPTLWAKDQSLSSTRQRCSLPFSESKEWLGPCVSTIPLVSIPEFGTWEMSLTGAFYSWCS